MKLHSPSYYASRLAFHRLRKKYSRELSRYLHEPEALSPRPESPVIVIGMHRSGTSLTTRLLENLGVSMGAWQARGTSEALFFRHRNELLLSLCHASWDNPSALIRALENPLWRAALTRVVRSDIGSMRSRHFAPPANNRVTAGSPGPVWGFKDPRTSLTLPIWMAIFPNAKVINIIRHGKAVATSLLEREKRQMHKRLPLSLVSLDPGLGLHLWAEYVLAACRNSADLPDNRYCEIRYEQLLSSPMEVVQTLAEFAGLASTDETLARTAALITRTAKPVAACPVVSPMVQEALELYGYAP